MQVKDIKVPSPLTSDKICVCLLQLRSPFFREADIIRGTEAPIIGWPDRAYRSRCERLSTCLASLKQFNRHIDILVLPEYSIAGEMLTLISDYVQDTRTIVISAMYEAKSRRVKTFAAIPGKENSHIEWGDHTAPFKKRDTVEGEDYDALAAA